jgi:hypothetical protein
MLREVSKSRELQFKGVSKLKELQELPRFRRRFVKNAG